MKYVSGGELFDGICTADSDKVIIKFRNWRLYWNKDHDELYFTLALCIGRRNFGQARIILEALIKMQIEPLIIVIANTPDLYEQVRSKLSMFGGFGGPTAVTCGGLVKNVQEINFQNVEFQAHFLLKISFFLAAVMFVMRV